MKRVKQAVARHLSAQRGRIHAVLMETPRMGRTAQFAEAVFDTDQPEGRTVEAVITGQRDGQLLARTA